MLQVLLWKLDNFTQKKVLKHDSEGLAQIHAYFKPLDKYDRYEY